jgi:hypothetical protein
LALMAGLYESVAFDMRVAGTDTYGNPAPGAFVEQFRCRGGFTWLRGGETVIAARLEGQQPIVVRIRASSAARAIKSDWRMRNLRDGKVFAVRSISETDDRRWLDVMVVEGVAP